MGPQAPVDWVAFLAEALFPTENVFWGRQAPVDLAAFLTGGMNAQKILVPQNWKIENLKSGSKLKIEFFKPGHEEKLRTAVFLHIE